jgi:titin
VKGLIYHISHSSIFLSSFSDLPGRPGIPAYSRVTDNSIHLNWTPPEDDGGTPIFNYVIEYRLKGAPSWTRANKDKVPELEYTVKDLKTDKLYEFRIRAENKVGVGEPSQSTK